MHNHRVEGVAFKARQGASPPRVPSRPGAGGDAARRLTIVDSGVAEAERNATPPRPPMLTRRHLLLGLGSLGLALLLPARRAAAAAVASRTWAYRVEISMVFGLLRYTVTGSMVEEIDEGAGRYRMLITGTGTGVSTRIEARGMIDQGRYRPLEMKNLHSLAGRKSWLSISYDYDRGLVDYHTVGHTLLRGRRREVVDVVPMPAAPPVDDAVSTGLNFAAGQLERDADGAYRTTILRRVRPPGEGPEDVAPGGYRVQVVPVRFRVEPDPTTGKLVAEIDMAGWSSWARADQPARLVFAPDRRLESIESRLMFGSAIRMRLTS
jgi:hypothetical protein